MYNLRMDAFQALDFGLNLALVFWGALVVDAVSLIFYFQGKNRKVWAIITTVSIIVTVVSILGLYLSVLGTYSQLAQ